ncbi:MAG: periplasmic heavy metal sensor [Mucilaginibacter sp.]
MKNFKFLMIIVILLVIINCVLLGSLWFTKYRMSPPPPPDPPQRANEYLIKELKLTPAQIKQYDTLREHHFEKTKALNEQIRQLRDAYFENIQTPVLNTKATDSLEKKITANTATLDSTTLFHFRKLRTILDNDQKTRFDKIVQNALHMMGGPQNGPQGGPPPQQMRPPGRDDRMPPPRRMGKGEHPGGPRRPGMGRPGGPPPDGMGPPPGGPPDRDMMPPPGGPPPFGRPPGGGPPPNGGPPQGGPPPGF